MIVLVDKSCAREGYEFVYLGEAKECRECGLKLPCHHNLEKGRRYAVDVARSERHYCRIFDEVVVCEVREVGIEVAINRDSAFEGATLTFHPIDCKESFCKFIANCRPEGLREGDRCTVERVIDRMVCPKKGGLTRVSIRRV
jgi:uncharacterized protein (UPF0179 family)